MIGEQQRAVPFESMAELGFNLLREQCVEFLSAEPAYLPLLNQEGQR